MLAVIAGLDTHIFAVILRSRALARRLEGWPRAPVFVAHPSRLAAKGGEHLRMTAQICSGGSFGCRPFVCANRFVILAVVRGLRQNLVRGAADPAPSM